MLTFRRSLSCACLFALGLLTGCTSEPDRPRRPQEIHGGFSVLVGEAGRPPVARVLADIGSYAQGRGFAPQAALPGPPVDPITHESLPAAPARYQSGIYELEVSYQPVTHRVSAYLHGSGPGGNRKFVLGFYHDFDQAYAPRYGGDDPISEIGFADDSGGPTVAERPLGASVPGPGGGLQGPDSSRR